MKREFLKNLGLTDEVIDKIMAENGTDIQTAKAEVATIQQKLTTAETENAGLKTQIAGRDADIKRLQDEAKGNAGLTEKLSTLQTQYDKDTKELQEKLAAQAYDHAAERYLDGFKFSSAYARKAVLADFREKKFKFSDGKFEGADEYMKSLKKEDPSTFLPDDEQTTGTGNEPQQPQPKFTGGFGGTTNKPGDPNLFDFGFTPVRETQKK